MRRAGQAALLALGWLLSAVGAGADYLYSKDFTEAAQAVLARRYVDARSIAERMLEQDPVSFEAHAILGQVHLRGEEDLGLAELHLGKARRLLEARYHPPLDESGPLALHQEILRNLRQTAYLREQYERSLQLLDEYDRLYDPDLDYLRGWPLLKLGRFAQAKTVVEKAQAELPEDDPRQVDLWDTLGQLAYEGNDPSGAESAFQAASTLETDTADQPDPVYLTNLGEVYRDQLRFEEAESTWLEAAGWPHPGTYAEPHERLACLYAGQARWPEALEQLELSLAWRANLWPQVAAHTRASHLTSVGEVLVALGQSELAVQVLSRALAAPDRQALSSGQTGVALAKRYALYAQALQLQGRKAAERASWSSGRAWWEARREALECKVVAAWARTQVGVILARGELRPALRPYGPAAMQSPWLLPELAASLGLGPTRLALRAAPEAASSAQPEPLAYLPYRFLLGSDDTTDSALPQTETLARAALLARAEKWSEALRLDPEVARRGQQSIGVTVEGSPQVADLLLASPSLHSGLDLTVTVSANLSALVTDAEGKELARTGPNPDPSTLAADLHRRLFSPPLEWSAQRLSALTHEPSPGRMASARLEKLLDGE